METSLASSPQDTSPGDLGGANFHWRGRPSVGPGGRLPLQAEVFAGTRAWSHCLEVGHVQTVQRTLFRCSLDLDLSGHKTTPWARFPPLPRLPYPGFLCTLCLPLSQHLSFTHGCPPSFLPSFMHSFTQQHLRTCYMPDHAGCWGYQSIVAALKEFHSRGK